MERNACTQFRVWLYQGDGVTINTYQKVRNYENVIARFQKAVKQRANELGVPTRLEVDFNGQQQTSRTLARDHPADRGAKTMEWGTPVTS